MLLQDPTVTEAFDAMEEGIQILSPEWRYLYLNAAAARQGRKPREQLIGKTMLECYPGIEGTPMFKMLERCMRERASDRMENEFAYEDGKRAWFELRVHPCRAGLVLASLDMTVRKGVELRMDEAYRQALRDLVTPVIRVHDGVLLVPIVGALDKHRSSQMAESVLTRVAEEGAKVVIFDIAGIPVLDTAIAHELLQTTAMIRLLGATTILTGVAAAAAKSLVQLGVDLSAMTTTSRLAQGIELALEKIGRVTVKR